MGDRPAPRDENADPSDDAEGSERAPQKRTGISRPFRIAYAILILLLIVIMTAGGYLYNLGRIYDSKTTKIEPAFPAEAVRPPPTEPQPNAASGPIAPAKAMNILVLGSDSRGASADEAESGTPSNQRADTIMLVHIPADRSSLYTISLMRDLWVNIPDNGKAKINAALAFGGVPLMVHTVEDLLEQRIDHVIMIDFEGFKGLTNALGGVEVDIKQAFTSHHDHLKFKKGKTVLDGERALAFVRERYAYADGDYQRVRNQQTFLRSLINKTLSAGTLTNPVTVTNAVDSMAPFISVDKGLDALTLGALAFSLRDVQDRAVFFTLPTYGTGTSSDGQSIVLPNIEAIRDIAEALSNDTLGEYVAANGLEGGN